MATSAQSLSRVKDLFGQALDLPPADRAAFLTAQAGDDAEHLSAVRALLDSHERVTGILDRPSGATLPPMDFTEPTPKSVGPYRIESVIGEGGFGTVYSAEQTEPVRRRVAIKVLKPGMDSRQILARFDAERQALALMDHPNIARVLDAGTTESGRPYFVMELVRGTPVTQYCDEHRLGTSARLELFSTICQAVHHAHQKGVIHRDIKPSNVLIAEQDDKPVPKIIDFGVAKAMQAPLTNFTLHTEIRQLIGTPEYMSPEQAGGDGIDIDTRSDVYSLGVLLYELITGATPFDGGDLRRAALNEMQRIIREVDPPKPSTRISRIETNGDVANRRGTEITRLRSQIKGEVDWIVMKCLEKDRARRYESASALAGDIRSHLAGLPVVAGPPTNAYRLRKFVSRHKIGISMAALLLLSLIGGLAATLAALRQAQVERDRAAEASDIARQHVRFIEEMFESISPEQTRGRQVTVREMLDVAAARVAGSFRGRPTSEAAIRETFGRAYAGIGQLERSKQQIEQALAVAGSPNSHDERALNVQLRELLGSVQMEMGNYPEAEQTLREVLAESKRDLGESHISTLSIKERLASTLQDRSRLEDALALRKELDAQVANLPPEMIRVVLAQKGNYGILLQAMDRPAEAEKMYREAIETGARVLGGDHPDVIGSKLALGTLLRDRGDFAGAMACLDEVYKEAQRVFGPDHPNTLVAAHTAGLVMSAAGRAKDAEVLLADCVDRCKRVLGEDHPTTLYTAHDLAQIYMVTRRFELAEPVMADIIPRMQRTFGEDHRDTLMYRGDYARIISARGEFAAAEEIYRDISERLARTLGPDHEYAMTTRARLGSMLVQQKKFGEAEPILAASYAAEKQRTGRRIAWATQASYGLCLQQLGKYDEAIPILLEAEALIRAYPRLDRSSMKTVAFALAECYEATGKPEDATRYRSIEREVMTTQPATKPAPVLN